MISPVEYRMTDKEAMDAFIRKDILEREFGSLRGLTVVNVRAMTRAECEAFGWEWDNNSHLPMIVEFHDGTIISPMSDPEGNNAGFMFIGEFVQPSVTVKQEQVVTDSNSGRKGGTVTFAPQTVSINYADE